MIKNISTAISSAARTLFGNWQTIAGFVAIYAVFVFLLYLFFTTGEAKYWQVALTILLMIAIPILFFVIQAMSVSYTNKDVSFGLLSKQSLRDFWKLLVITIPFLLLAWLVIWGINKIDFTWTTGIREAAFSAGTETKIKAAEDRIKLIHNIATSLNWLLLFLIIPLFSIQLWITTLRDGIKKTLTGLFRVIIRAFAPRAVITYLLGLIIFGLIPYFIIATRTPVKSPWLDLSILGMRIGISLIIIFVGWIITLGALRILTSENPRLADATPVEQG